MGDFTLGCLLGQYDHAQSFDVDSVALAGPSTLPNSWHGTAVQNSYYFNDKTYGGAVGARVHSSDQSLLVEVYSSTAAGFLAEYGYAEDDDAYARWFPEVTTHALNAVFWAPVFSAADSGAVYAKLYGGNHPKAPLRLDYVVGRDDMRRLSTTVFSGQGADGRQAPHLGFIRDNAVFADSATFWIDDVLVSTDEIPLHPDWALRERARVIKSEHRTLGGNLYSYRWNQFFAYSVPLRFLSDSHAALVNWWWEKQFNLLFTLDTSDTEAMYVCRITNDRQPIGRRVRPYDNLWEGTLQLESINEGSLVF